jgi:predicted enzyme related to lactoylglutathione lyase
MATTHIAFVMYPVTDMPRAVAFYEETLGLKKDGLASDFWVEFDVAGTTFGIGNFEQVGTPGTGQSLALEVKDLDAFVGRLRERGVDVTDPHDLTICRICAVRDPDGNQVWLHERAAGR